MAKDTVEVLIEGGSATPGPPLGPALGPFGINMMQVVEEINKKSADFAGMKVPVIVTIDRDTKDFEIEIGQFPKNSHKFPKGCFPQAESPFIRLRAFWLRMQTAAQDSCSVIKIHSAPCSKKFLMLYYINIVYITLKKLQERK